MDHVAAVVRMGGYRRVADVANARKQFSDINGPVAWKHGRRSVDEFPASQISSKTHQLVDSYLRQRAAGTGSSVGGNLNYANPNASDRKNLAWINKLDGPVLGSGSSIHRHGTTSDLEKYKPGAYGVEVEVKFANAPPGTTAKVTTSTGAIAYTQTGQG